MLIFVLKLSTLDGNRGLQPAFGYPLMDSTNCWISWIGLSWCRWM